MADTLVVGEDIGSVTLFALTFDWRRYEFSKRAFRFSNTQVGFLTLIRWVEEMMRKTVKAKVIVGCEPIGCYWSTFQKFLTDKDILLVTVNPYIVKKCKELDDKSPEKSDLNDPKSIAGLIREGRYSNSYLPKGV